MAASAAAGWTAPLNNYIIVRLIVCANEHTHVITIGTGYNPRYSEVYCVRADYGINNLLLKTHAMENDMLKTCCVRGNYRFWRIKLVDQIQIDISSVFILKSKS